MVQQWDEIKREGERGGALFGAAAREPSITFVRRARCQRQAGHKPEPFEIVGDLFFQAVAAARALDVDPELALREAANRFDQSRVGEPTRRRTRLE